MLDAVLDAVLLVDVDGRIVFANRACERLFGYPLAELLGRPVEMLVPPAVGARHAALRQAYAAAPVPRAMGAGLDLVGVRRDGSTFPADVSLGSLEVSGSPLITAVVRDLTPALHPPSAAAAGHGAEWFRAVIERAPIPMLLLDARPGREGRLDREPGPVHAGRPAAGTAAGPTRRTGVRP